MEHGLNKTRLISILLLCASIYLPGCSTQQSTVMDTGSSPATTEEATIIDTDPEPTEEVTEISYEVAEEDIVAFQGEWKEKGAKYRKLIISGQTVNFISFDIVRNTEIVDKVFTFCFEYDENDQLVVCNQYHQPRYVFSITEDGQLKEQSTYSDDETLYDYVSENTDVPDAVPDPAIGMTADEVLTSKWGYPKKKNITQTATSTSEQWVYDQGYIYLTDGIVTAIQK
nr:hypothetical protein [uncultured Acetatifactor sp.]